MKPRTVLQNEAGADPSRGDAAYRALPSILTELPSLAAKFIRPK